MFSLYSSPLTNLSYSKSPMQSSPLSFQCQHHNQWSPQTPSPLRTSRNANLNRGFMTTPERNNGFKPSTLANSSPVTDENAVIEYSSAVSSAHQNAFQTPVSTAANENSNSSTTSTNNTSSTFSFTSRPSTTKDMTKPNFAFESRARSSSPSALLSRHAVDSREKRKTRFLDRIRNRREDGRDGRAEEQVLRMDYVRDRRSWEEMMARRAKTLDVNDSSGEMEMDMDMVDTEEGISPTEDKEIEDLIGFLEEQDKEYADSNLGEEDDDEYDALFMEVLSQEVVQPSSKFGETHITKDYDSSMDMS